MPTIRLVPSTYYLSNSNYLSVSNAANMYVNTDSTNYATVTNSRTSTSSYYIYVRGFNFDDIPSNAIVSDFTIKIKCNYSGGYAQAMYLYDGTSTSYGNSDSISSTVTTHTFTCNHSWADVVAAGSDFGIRINCRRSSRNTTSYVYIYGAEIEVTYTIPVYHTVTSSTDSGTISPSGSTQVLEGDSYSLTISGITPTVTDNSVDVTSQLIQTSEVTEIGVPESNTNSGWYSTSDITNAYNGADNDTYASFQLAGGGTTGTVYLDIGSLSIPSGATIKSVSCQATLQYNRNNSSSGFTASCQMYAGSTAKGSATTVVSAGGTDVAKTTFTLSVGSWTAIEIANARFFLTATNNASSTRRYIYIYGVSFSVTYESDGVVYIYTISSVTRDHTIIVTQTGSTTTLYFKQNGSWVAASKVYKKVNGVWVQQGDLSNVFDSGTNYVKG